MAKADRQVKKTFRPLKGSKHGCDEIVVQGNGRQTYVWFGLDDKHVCNIAGTATLRGLAKTILKALEAK